MVKKTFFISDLHLSVHTHQNTQAFLEFMQYTAPQGEALYILGDFFDTWIGDDDQSDFHSLIISTLKTLSKTTPIFFLHGNRDFLIGKAFATQAGLTLLPDPVVISCYERRILLTHGDLLCTEDKRHQRYRKIVHCRLIQKIFLCLPLTKRRQFAQKMRQQSQQHQAGKPYIDVSTSTVQSYFTRYKTDLMIHGHTHRPNQHTHGDIKDCTRIVLGSWENQAHYLTMTQQHDFSFNS